MTPTEAIASIRASIAAGLSPSLSDIEVLIAECGRVEGLDWRPNIDALVNAFLAWPLPKSVCADGCATDTNYPHSRNGTNLLTAVEAKAMFEHVLGRVVGSQQQGKNNAAA